MRAAVNPERRSTLLWLLVAGAVWGLAVGVSRWRREPERPPAPAWQRPVSELTEAQQAHYAQVRAAILEAERVRSAGAWPTTFLPGSVFRQQRLTVNYVSEAAGLRWLVLFLEPDPRSPPEKAAPDDEHHTLADGTPLHVTVWTQPLSVPAPENVTAFPAAEGWVERVRR